MSSIYPTLVGWRHVLESLLSLGPRLSDVQWSAPTECPDWTVKDIFAHLIGGEQWMIAGHPVPAGGFEEWASGPVLARRDTPAPVVLQELRRVYEQRRVQCESAGAVDTAAPAHLVTGQRTTLGTLLEIRVFDVWAHEQDIRRAVGEPGNLDSPAAAVAGRLCVAALPRIVAKAAGAPPGVVLRLTTTGEVPVDVAVAVGPDGRGSLVAPDGSAAAHATLSWEAYTRLSCGRGSRDDYDVKITGDRVLADRVLAHLTITP
jgi:uncharacterized protein (TIGR03083 family)